MTNKTQESNAEMTDAARYLAKQGFQVFALQRPYKNLVSEYLAKKNGKLPGSLRHYFRALLATTPPDQAITIPEGSNIAVMTGRKYNLVLIDVDFPDGGKESMRQFDLPETLTAQTGNGIHLYYRHPGRRIPTSAGRLAPGIDIKGDVSFATAPPSRHPSGARYRWVNEEVDMADLPPDTVKPLRALPHRGLPAR